MLKKAESFMILFFVGLLPFIMVLGNSMFIPILPSIQADLSLNTVQAGLILTCFSIPAAMLIPVAGLLSDRYGKRKLALVSLILIMLGSVIAVISGHEVVKGQALLWMLGGRLLQGVGAGGIAPLAMVFASELFAGKQLNKALGVLEAFNGAAKVLSPMIGGLIVAVSWYYSFAVFFASALLAFFGMLLLFKPDATVTGVRKPIKEMLKQGRTTVLAQWKWLVPIFFTGGIGMFVLFGMLFFLSYDMETSHGLYGITKGLLLALPLGVLALISYVSGRTLATSEFSYRKGIAGGLFIMFVGSALLVISQGLLPLLTGMTLLSLGFGIFLPAASSAIASVVSAEDRGGIFSYYSMIRFLGVALGPTVFGSWMINVEQMMFNSFFIMSLSLLSILFSWSCIPIIQACSPPFET